MGLVGSVLGGSLGRRHGPGTTSRGPVGWITQGRSITKLPLRQVYYWNTGTTNSLLLASYDDTDDVGFWQGLAVEDSKSTAN